MNRDYLPHALLIRKAYDNGIRVDDHSFAISDNGLMIAIAGTANIENVLEDIDIVPKAFCGHSVHGGCVDAFEELDEAIRPHILKSGTVIIGHSLGGGIAQLFGIKYNLPVVTFGSLALYCNHEKPNWSHLRIVNNGDPVPDLPPSFYHNSPSRVLGMDDWRIPGVEYHGIDAYIKELKR